LQRWLAVHSLVNQGPKIAAADSGSWSTHGRLLVNSKVLCVLHFLRTVFIVEVEDENAAGPDFVGVPNGMETILNLGSGSLHFSNFLDDRDPTEEKISWRQHYE
jgi:hypothetical protein